MIFVTFHTKVFLIIKGYRQTISMDLTLTSVATIGLTLNTANIILTWKRENCLSKHQGVSKYFIILKVILNQCNDVKALGLRSSIFIIQNKQVPSKPCALKGMRWLDCKFHHNTSVSIEVGSGRQWSGVNTSFKRTLRWNNLYLILTIIDAGGFFLHLVHVLGTRQSFDLSLGGLQGSHLMAKNLVDNR